VRGVWPLLVRESKYCDLLLLNSGSAAWRVWSKSCGRVGEKEGRKRGWLDVGWVGLKELLIALFLSATAVTYPELL
jgi:hypothetical protein